MGVYAYGVSASERPTAASLASEDPHTAPQVINQKITQKHSLAHIYTHDHPRPHASAQAHVDATAFARVTYKLT